MPDNGSGSYSPPASTFPYSPGTLIQSANVNSNTTDTAVAISNRICKDGQTTITANLPMNGFKFTGVGPGAARTDTATIANLQDGTGVYVASVSGTGDAIILLPSPAIAAYAVGQCFRFIVGTTNTTAVTVAVSGLTAKAVVLRNAVALIAGDLIAGNIAELTYDGSQFILSGRGTASANSGQTLVNDILTTCTVTADPTVPLGVASKQYVDALWTTGDIKVTLKTTADTGWVLFNDGTIGSASSGATTRANADTLALFTLLWTNTANIDCAVSTGRGASAAADFAANKTIALPKVLGRALAVAGAGSGLTSRALARALGSEDAIVVSHTHTATVTDPGHTHGALQTDQLGGSVALTIPSDNSVGTVKNGVVQSNTTGITVANSTTGASGTGANMMPSVFLNVMVKL